MTTLVLLLACSGLPTWSQAPAPQTPQPATVRAPDPHYVRGARDPSPEVFEPGRLLHAMGVDSSTGEGQAALLDGPAGLQVWSRSFGRWSVHDTFEKPKTGSGRVAGDNTLWWFDDTGVTQPDDPAVSWRARPGCPPTDLFPQREGAFVLTACDTFLRVPPVGGQDGPELPWKVTHAEQLGRAVAARVVTGDAMKLQWGPTSPPPTALRELDLGPACPSNEPWVGIGAGAAGSTVIAATCDKQQLVVWMNGHSHRLSLEDQLPTNHGKLFVANEAPLAIATPMGALVRVLAWAEEDLLPVGWAQHALPAGARLEVPTAETVVKAKATLTLDVTVPEGFEPLKLLPGHEGWTLLGMWPVDGKPTITSLEIERPRDEKEAPPQ